MKSIITFITFITLTTTALFSINAIGREYADDANKPPQSKNVELAHSNLEEVIVWSEGQDSQSSGYSSPTSLLTQSDMISINIATTEDLVKFEPGIIIRRRFIGDSNGTLGIRSANMFQTPRSMVFADGVPLHYFLESRWKGAPRWTMVSASEIAQVEIVYGPFSAEYSGNAMGGAVLIETAIPQEQELHIDGSFFRQQFDDYGFDDRLGGYKGFLSYGNKVDNVSYYFSYNHLENDSQPQTFRDSGLTQPNNNPTSSPPPIPVTGAIFQNDSLGRSRAWYGDTGTVKTKTDNYKVKLGYEISNWASLLNIAYEDRSSLINSTNFYLLQTGDSSNEESIWSSPLIQNGQIFSVNSSHLNDGEIKRESLSVGLRLRGQLSDSIKLETNINQFEILKDENRKSKKNLSDPSYMLNGSVTEYKNSGWKTGDVKLTFDDIFTKNIHLITGLRHEIYELNLDQYNSSHYKNGLKDSFSSRFGGKTSLTGAFVQFNWDFSEYIDIAFGVRRERFKSSDGYFGDDDTATPEYELTRTPSESKNRTSPKLSLGLKPAHNWLVRYSLAKAYRFPIIEELFSQHKDFNSSSIARPDLNPEDGIFQNIMLERTFEDGYLRTNIFIDNVKNTIESQLYRSDDNNNNEDVRTFSPIDRVKTLGVEFIFNKTNVIIDNFDLRFNLSYTDAEIVENKLNTGSEGNQAPRQAKWRSHLLSTYHLNEDWTVSGNLQYASNSYGRITNDDNEDNVYGAQDGYTRIGFNTRYKFTENITFGLGIDNITNEIVYVTHPWPGRTLYMHFSYDM